MQPTQVFRRFGLWTILAVYLLILVGGIVRATGAGMGCPDWPKCFGSWIPPTHVDQLPDNYQEIFGAKLKGEVVFNPVKTWTEYVNRLVGVVIGLFIFITFLMAAKAYWQKDRVIVWYTLGAFLLVMFEGWLGAKVVSTELAPGMITLHMLVAVVIVFMLIYALMRSYREVLQNRLLKNQAATQFLILLALALSLGQLFLGTQIREAVDIVLHSYGRDMPANWNSLLGGQYYFHIALGLLIAGLQVYYAKQAALTSDNLVITISKYMLWIVGIEIATGLLLGYAGLPAFAQPIHLVLSVGLLGLQFVSMLLLTNRFSNQRATIHR